MVFPVEVFIYFGAQVIDVTNWLKSTNPILFKPNSKFFNGISWVLPQEPLILP